MKPPFLFDGATGLVTTSGPASRSPLLCPHLREPLALLLAAGSAIVGTCTGWTQVELEIALSSGPSLSALPALGLLRAPVSSWSNDDSHYPLQSGLVCGSCRHSISWPR